MSSKRIQIERATAYKVGIYGWTGFITGTAPARGFISVSDLEFQIARPAIRSVLAKQVSNCGGNGLTETNNVRILCWVYEKTKRGGTVQNEKDETSMQIYVGTIYKLEDIVLHTVKKLDFN